MANTESTMVELGSSAPGFRLPDVATGKYVELDDFAQERALLVMFICAHCPYVKHLEAGLAELGRDYKGKGVGIVAISSNDAEEFPDDAPPALAAQANRLGFVFPYLYDETQEVARSYDAACTPDFFLFDGDRRLVYRGEFDASRPQRKGEGNDLPVTGSALRAAMDAVLAGKAVPEPQWPSIGCNIKWRE
jgi:peroxiredoxin